MTTTHIAYTIKNRPHLTLRISHFWNPVLKYHLLAETCHPYLRARHHRECVGRDRNTPFYKGGEGVVSTRRVKSADRGGLAREWELAGKNIVATIFSHRGVGI